MAIRFYMDHHIPRAVTAGLRLRGVDILTAHEDQSHRLADEDLLDRANAYSRIPVTSDAHFLAEATVRQREGLHFKGIIFAHPALVSIGNFVRDLELIAKVGSPEDFADRVEFLPL
jgi:hypothetical protein